MKGRGIKPGQVGLKIDYLFEREKFFAKNYTGVRGHFYYENKNEPDFLYGSRLFEAVLRENYKDVLMLIIEKIRDRYDLTMSLKDDPDADEKFSVMENYCLYPAVADSISEPFGIHYEDKDGPLAKKHFNASTEIAQNSEGDEYIGFTRYLGDALTNCGIQLPAEFGRYMLDKANYLRISSHIKQAFGRKLDVPKNARTYNWGNEEDVSKDKVLPYRQAVGQSNMTPPGTHLYQGPNNTWWPSKRH